MKSRIGIIPMLGESNCIRVLSFPILAGNLYKGCVNIHFINVYMCTHTGIDVVMDVDIYFCELR